MINGAGILGLTFELENTSIMPETSSSLCYSLFSFTREITTRDGEYLNRSGQFQTRSSLITEERFILELTIENTDFHDLEIALGELAVSNAEEDTTYQEITICPLEDSEYSNPLLQGIDGTLVSCFNKSSESIMVGIDSAGVQENEYFVDTTTGTITFSLLEVGQIIIVSIPVTGAFPGRIGGDNSSGEFYTYSFEGSFFSTSGDGPYTIKIPKMRRISAPTLDFSGGEAVNYVLTFEAVCNESRKPFTILAGAEAPILEVDYLLHEDSFSVLYEDECLIELEGATTNASTLLLQTDDDFLLETGFPFLLEDQN